MRHGNEIDLSKPCHHAKGAILRHLQRPTAGCEECLRLGADWVHLRACLTCGHVGCCDDSPNRHATAHFRQSGHPLITSAEVGESWSYCYLDDRLLSDI